MKKELLNGLNDEQIEKAKECKSQEELLEFAKAEGIQLTDEQLEAVSGGWCSETTEPCPKCGSTNVKKNIAETTSICAPSSFVRIVNTNGTRTNFIKISLFFHYLRYSPTIVSTCVVTTKGYMVI